MTDRTQSLADIQPEIEPRAKKGPGLAHILLEGRAFIALLVIIAVFSSLSPNYFSGANFLTMASHVAIFGLPAIGMLLVILNGGIDLSVGSTLGLAGVCAGFMMQGINIEALGVVLYLPVWAVAILTLAVGALVGLVNGILIAWCRVPAFVATLGSLYVARGIALLITNGLTYNKLSGSESLGNTGFDWLGFNRIFTVPIGVLILGIVALACGFLLSKTAFGRWLYASGGNERAAEAVGRSSETRQNQRLRPFRDLRCHGRTGAFVSANLCRSDGRHDLRTYRHCCRCDRWGCADRRAWQRARHTSRRFCYRFSL